MSSPRRALAVSLATATLVVFLATIAMATTAYVLSREEGSFPVAGRLAASGLVGLVYGLVATDFLAAATFMGPVFGVIIGLPMLALGVAKGVETRRGSGL